jgi:uncharacterized protein (DUF2141 family)
MIWALIALQVLSPNSPEPFAVGRSLQVRVHGVENRQGQVIVEACARAVYPRYCEPLAVKGPDHRLARREAIRGDTRININGIYPGRYVIRAIHDENGNGVLDGNEGQGFSRTPAGGGKPDFDAAAIDVGNGRTFVDVELGYGPH